MDNKLKFDVTIIVNAHKEYILLYKTLLSVARAKRHSLKSGLSVETIIVLDSPDNQMRELVECYSKNMELLIDCVHEISVKSLGAARNSGVLKSQGKFVAFMDGDDLCSEEWITRSYKICNADKNFIAHPEICIFFENTPHWWRHPDQRDPSFDVKHLLYHNYWLALSFGSRDIYLKVPYHAFTPSSGLGFEDWHWNCNTVHEGFTHVSVSGVIHFIRKKKPQDSLNFMAASANCLIPATGLLVDSNVWKSDIAPKRIVHVKKNPFQIIQSLLKGFLRLGFKTIWVPLNQNFPNSSILKLINKIIAAPIRLLKKVSSSDLPDWTILESRKVSAFEPLLFPNTNFLFKTRHSAYGPNNPKLVELYREAFLEFFDKKIDAILVVPWIKSGGADMGVLHYANTLSEEGLSVIVIATENSDSPWKDRLNPGIDFVELGKISNFKNISLNECTRILGKFFVQKQPQLIHIINSLVGWETIGQFGKAIKYHSRIYASLFCDNYITQEGERVGYKSFLQSTYSYFDRIFSDNTSYPAHLKSIDGYSDKIFSTIYFPVSEKILNRGEKRVSTSHKRKQGVSIFWAGRMDLQKRPDILFEICKRMPQVKFDVWGGALLDKSSISEKLKKLPNVTLKGYYKSYDIIPSEEYDLYLYTSQWDGLPIALIEAAASGIPIVASMVGGVGDLINTDNGYPVFEIENVDEYCTNIMRIFENPEEAKNKAKSAIELLKKRHLQSHFRMSLLGQDGYNLSNTRENV